MQPILPLVYMAPFPSSWPTSRASVWALSGKCSQPLITEGNGWHRQHGQLLWLAKGLALFPSDLPVALLDLNTHAACIPDPLLGLG